MINKTWDTFLNNEFQQDYFVALSAFLKKEYEEKNIYPPKKEVFSSFYFTDKDKVKVVILGQDPYHQPGQACGMCFAVKPGVKLPASLQNIYKEISAEYGYEMSKDGYLLKWAQQGVLLLNTCLTVEDSKPNAHKGQGWEIFTDHVIEELNRLNQPIVFLLWGANAKTKTALLNNPKHLVLTSAHPSPLSAYHGFFGNNHFRTCNEFLIRNHLQPIEWKM